MVGETRNGDELFGFVRIAKPGGLSGRVIGIDRSTHDIGRVFGQAPFEINQVIDRNFCIIIQIDQISAAGPGAAKIARHTEIAFGHMFLPQAAEFFLKIVTHTRCRIRRIIIHHQNLPVARGRSGLGNALQADFQQRRAVVGADDEREGATHGFRAGRVRTQARISAQRAVF